MDLIVDGGPVSGQVPVGETVTLRFRISQRGDYLIRNRLPRVQLRLIDPKQFPMGDWFRQQKKCPALPRGDYSIEIEAIDPVDTPRYSVQVKSL